MKNLCLVLLFLMNIGKMSAQSRCYAGDFYASQYFVEEVALNGSYPKCDAYGNYIGHFQQFNKAVWHRNYGRKIVHIATPNGWITSSRVGDYYWFNWVTYEKQVGYHQPPVVTRPYPVIVPAPRVIVRRPRVVRRPVQRRFRHF